MLSICEGDGDKIERCPLVFTKPGYVTPEIQRWAAVATRLSRLKEGGAAYAYPDGLTPAEWAAIDALQLARIENDSQDSETRQTEVATDAAITRLEAAKRRR